jgi:hypothetical protein
LISRKIFGDIYRSLSSSVWCLQRYKMVALNFLLNCQNHSAQYRTAEQQHRQLCIYTALCCVLREDH